MANRGGRRGTSWSTSWRHGKTTVIRVPQALADKIIKYAQALDSDSSHIDPEQLQAAILLEIDKFVELRVQQFHPNQYSRVGKTDSRRWDELRKFRKVVATSSPLPTPSASLTPIP